MSMSKLNYTKFDNARRDIEVLCRIIREKDEKCFVYSGYISQEDCWNVFVVTRVRSRSIKDIIINKDNTDGVLFRMDHIEDSNKLIEGLKEYIKTLN